MSQIEMIGQAGFSLTVDVRDPLANYASLATGLSVTEITPTVYRAALGSLDGLVHCLFKAGAVRFAAGYANLDEPGENGYSDVFDTLGEAESAGQSLSVTVLPSQVQQNPRNKSSTLKLYVGETITVSHQVLDANGSPVTLTGMTLLLVIEDRQGNVIASITPTISGSTFSGVITSPVTQKSGRPLIWALRNKGAGAGNAVVGEGAVEVQYAPGV
jgi:hypothetical protein